MIFKLYTTFVDWLLQPKHIKEHNRRYKKLKKKHLELIVTPLFEMDGTKTNLTLQGVLQNYDIFDERGNTLYVLYPKNSLLLEFEPHDRYGSKYLPKYCKAVYRTEMNTQVIILKS